MADKSFPMRVLVRATMLMLGMVGLLALGVPRASASLGGPSVQEAPAVAATQPVLLAGGRAGRDGQAGDRFPKRGSSASLQGGSSADRYGGATGDRRGVARAEEVRGAKKKPDDRKDREASTADQDERLREERERKADERGDGGGEGAGGVLGGLGRAPKD